VVMALQVLELEQVVTIELAQTSMLPMATTSKQSDQMNHLEADSQPGCVWALMTLLLNTKIDKLR